MFDRRLVRDAELLATGASIHTTRELVAMYKGVADPQTPQEHEAQAIWEEALRDHVHELRLGTYRKRRIPIASKA